MLLTGVSRKGGRIRNEDAYGEARAEGILCAIVADGLGGHYGGEIASRLAVDTIINKFIEDPGVSEEHIKKYIEAANSAIVSRAESDPEHVHMSSTIVVLLKKGGRAIWANVGDSRLYLFNHNTISEVTEDHSLAFLDFMRGEIEYDDIRQSENQNKLTSALGVGFDEINISKVTHIGSSASFLLCTDGWWEYVNEDQMEETLCKSKNTRSWLEAMVKIREENAPEDSDNYTAIAIMP